MTGKGEAAAPGWGGSVKRGMAWSVLAFSASKALSLISILVLARLLTPGEFGTVAAVAAYIALVELGSDLGMRPAVVYEQEAGISRRVQTAFTLNLAMAAVLTAVAVLLAPSVAELFGVGDHADLFRLGALNLLLTGLGNIHDGVLLRDMDFSRRIRPQVVRDVLRVTVSVGLAVAGMGAASLVVGFLAGSAGWVVWQWRLTPLRPRLILDVAAAREMIGYGAAAALLEVMAVIAGRTDIVVIGALIGTHALGIYTIAYRLPEVLLAGVAYTLAVVAFPALARKRQESADALAQATLTLLRYQALYALPVAAGLGVLSGALIAALFPAVWAAAAPAMIAVSAGLAVSTATFPLGDLLKATGRQSTLVKLNCLNIPLLVAACVLAAPAGVTAVAWALAGCSLVFGTLLCVIVAREIAASAAQMARALGPGAAAGLGVAAGGLAIRLTWSDPVWPALLVAAACAAAGGVLALRLFAPSSYRDLSRPALQLLRARLRPAAA
jgi:lipopolysaccharide exporter